MAAKEELSFFSRMKYAFNYFVYSAQFEGNTFLNDNFRYTQAYTASEYGELLEDLRLSTLKLYDKDHIKAAAYFLPRFIQIKPFARGNGRLARLVLNLILTSRDIEPPLFLSNNQYQKMYISSWSKTQYLPLDLILNGEKVQDAPSPFENFLRHTMCTQDKEREFFSELMDMLQQCEQGCQGKMDNKIGV